jgi:hypothetical protein
MACRGVHFAIDKAQLEKLLAAESDTKIVEIIQEEIEEVWDEEWLHETDKAWDAIHRCLTDGKLEWNNGGFPFNAAIMGGRQLHQGDNHILSLVTPDQVTEVAKALQIISKTILREQYYKIEPLSYDGDLGEEDFEYTWEWFEGLSPLFHKAAYSGRAVIFSVDQ